MTQRHADQSPEAIRSHRKPLEAPQGVAADSAPAWEMLQRALGNQGTQRAVERETMRVEQQRAELEGTSSVSADTQARIDALSHASADVEAAEASFHLGPEVDQLAHGLSARAFTQGSNVFIASGGRDSATLAHELTHVAQGRAGPGTVQRAPEEPEEIEMPEMYVGRDPQLAGAADATTPPPADPITGGEATQTSVQESTSPQVEAPAPAPDDPERAKAIAEAEKLIAEMDAADAAPEAPDADEPQVSMRIPEPGEKPTYVKKQKKPAPAPHETLDPRTEAIIEGKLVKDDAGNLVNPLGPINRQERAERAWNEARWDEQFRQKKQAEAAKKDISREGVAIDLISGAAKEAPFSSTPSTGGEPEPADFPTLKTADKPEAKPEPVPVVPQKFSFALTIDNITKEYKDRTAEDAIAELKWRWISVRGYIDVYKDWHRDILANRADHPVVGFVVDFLGRRDPPDIRIWDELENDLGDAQKAIDLDVSQLRSDFEAKERRREEQEKRDDEERIAQGGTGLLKFRGINPRWATKADWERYMEGHIRGAVQSLQTAAHRIEARRGAVFYYKDKTIQTTAAAIKALEVAKEAGSFAASFIPGARYVYEGAAELATQTGEWLADADADFDWGKIGRATVTGAVTNFIGGKVGGRLGRAFENALTRLVAKKLGAKATNYLVNKTTKGVIKYLSEYGSNVATNPLNTALNATLQIAMDDPNKPKSWDDFENRLANELERAIGPRGIIESAAGTYIGNRTEGSQAPAPDFGYTATAPQRNVYAGGEPSSGVSKPAGETTPPTTGEVAPVTVAEAPTPIASQTTPAQAPAPTQAPATPTQTPIQAPAPRSQPGGDSPNDRPTRENRSESEDAQPTTRTEPSDAELAVGDRRTITRAVSEDAQPTTRTEPSDAELAVGDRRTTTRAVSEDAQPTTRTEPSDAELAVGDRRTTTRAVSEDAQPTTRTEPSGAELAVGDRRTVTRAVGADPRRGRRTGPSDAELAVGDQRTTTRAVDDATRQRPAEQPETTRVPVHDLPPGSVHRDLSYIEAYRSYNASVRQNPRFEAGIWRNRRTGEHVVIEGKREDITDSMLYNSPEFQTSKGQKVNGDDWHNVEHFHPGWGDKRQFYNRFPSTSDYRELLRSQRNRGTIEAVRSQIRAKDPVTGRDVITEYGYDPSNKAEPYWIRYKDQAGNTVTQRFSDTPWNPNSRYQVFLNGHVAAEPSANIAPDPLLVPADEQATGVWRVVEPPVPDTSAPAPAPRSTLPTNVDTNQGAQRSGAPVTDTGDATQGGPTARTPGNGPGEPRQQVPPRDPDSTTERVPAQGPSDPTQRMPAQGPVDSSATAPDMPTVGGSAGRSAPRGPVEIVPVESVSDARILMQGWPADRPMRLLANGEAKAAWNRDYGRPGEPPPAWMDPQAGLIVDTDRVPRPSSNETYHVPAEDPYVMFNVPSPQEALSIYRQNEAANAINPANNARSFLLDHSTFLTMFDRGRGYSPDKPAAFVDQNGRLYVDISRVDITSPDPGTGGISGPPGANNQAGTQTMGAQAPAGGPPPMPGAFQRPTQEMTPQTPVGEAPSLPQNGRNIADRQTMLMAPATQSEGRGPGGPPRPGGGSGGRGPGSRPSRGQADHLQDSVIGGRETVDVGLVARLNQEVDTLVQGKGIADGPNTTPALERSQTEVDLAIRILENPNSTWEATNQALEVIVERAVADYRAFRGTDLTTSGAQGGLTAANLRLMCGEGRDVSSDSIAAFTIGSRTPVIVHRMQAANLGIHEAQHGFSVIVLANGHGFIVDPTFAQFADRSLPGFRAGSMLSHRRGLETARNLLREGFMPMTPANVRAYVQGLGAKPREVDAAANRILAGDSALLTEVIVDGEVHRISTDPNEAENNIFAPHEEEGGVKGSIASIEAMLNSNRLAPNDPARPLLTSLLERLNMIAVRQPQLEADLSSLEALKWEPGAEEIGPSGQPPRTESSPISEPGHISPFLMGGASDGARQAPDEGGPGGPPPTRGAENADGDDPTLVDAVPVDQGGGAVVGQWGPPTREVGRQINDPQEAARLFIEQVRAGNRNARAIRNLDVLNGVWRRTFRQYTDPPLAWLDSNGNIVVNGLAVDIPGAVARGEG